MQLKKSQIRQIAEELETGMNVYINRKDLEIRTIYDYTDAYGDTEFWEEEYDKLVAEWSDFIVIEKLESDESFRIMQDFANKVDNDNLRQALHRKRPFANFKAIAENSKYRDEWFEFKTQKHEDYVKTMLELQNIAFEK
jgi:hypothetical protein